MGVAWLHNASVVMVFSIQFCDLIPSGYIYQTALMNLSLYSGMAFILSARLAINNVKTLDIMRNTP